MTDVTLLFLLSVRDHVFGKVVLVVKALAAHWTDDTLRSLLHDQLAFLLVEPTRHAHTFAVLINTYVSIDERLSRKAPTTCHAVVRFHFVLLHVFIQILLSGKLSTTSTAYKVKWLVLTAVTFQMDLQLVHFATVIALVWVCVRRVMV